MYSTDLSCGDSEYGMNIAPSFVTNNILIHLYNQPLRYQLALTSDP